MKRNYYIVVGIALIALPTWAQNQQTHAKDSTVNRTVTVEQEYTPDIIDASKINVLPPVEEPIVSKKEVEYATTWAPASAIPSQSMQAYTGKEVQATRKPGYVRLGYGNYGNLDLLGNYLFRLSPKDRLNVNFKMDGMNGELKLPNFDNNEKWDAHYYRSRANIAYVHQFNKLDLDIAGNFGLSNFNLPPRSVGKQKFTSGDLHFGVKSTDETLPLQFRAETNLMLYNRQQNGLIGATEGVDETLIRTKALVSGAINDEQLIHIALEMNNLFYQQSDYLKQVFNNRTLLHLNPYYELNNDSWLLHLGANVDFAFGNGKTRVSPDVTAQYLFSDSYILYAQATGGRQINDLRQLEELNPYAIYSAYTVDTYEQLNARLGFKTSPIPGLWFNLYGGYQNLKDDLLPFENSMDGGSIISSDYRYANTQNLYAGIQASYEYKELFSFSAEGTYHHWKANDDFEGDLLMKPKFKFNLQAEVHPFAALRLNVGYEYVQWTVNRIPSSTYKIPAVSNLYLGASYEVFKGIAFYVRANNLMNKAYQWYYTLPTEGINFVGGMSFQF